MLTDPRKSAHPIVLTVFAASCMIAAPIARKLASR
jgi:hypothetical protein